MSDSILPEPLKVLQYRYPQLGEIVRFGYELSMGLREIQPNLDLTGLKLTPEMAKIKLKEGFPLLEAPEIHIPPDQFERVFKKVSLLVAEKRESLSPKISEILDKVKNQKTDIHQLAQSNLKQDLEKDRKTHIKEKDSQSLLNFLIKASLKPFGHAYGSALNTYLPSDNHHWLQSYCPICGSKPSLAYIEGEEGQRHLLCSWCDTTWIFPRIKCPFCQNEDQKSLNYFSIEDEKEKKGKDNISVCKKCKRYIKTLDKRKWEETEGTDLQIDDLATFYLDLLAEREGYERITSHFLSF